MPRTVYTTTISLPKGMAKDIKARTRQEGRTVSELMRESFRCYELHHPRKRQVDWAVLNARLKKTSAAGKQVNLSEFLIRDRQSH